MLKSTTDGTLLSTKLGPASVSSPNDASTQIIRSVSMTIIDDGQKICSNDVYARFSDIENYLPVSPQKGGFFPLP